MVSGWSCPTGGNQAQSNAIKVLCDAIEVTCIVYLFTNIFLAMEHHGPCKYIDVQTQSTVHRVKSDNPNLHYWG